MRKQADLCLVRLRAKIAAELDRHQLSAADQKRFYDRLAMHWANAFERLHALYGGHYDFFYYLEQVALTLVRVWGERSDLLKAHDYKREKTPVWFQSQEIVGGALYVDLFSGTISRLKDHIPYFKELGISYLHIMPVFETPESENDGGYAISSYRDLHPSVGTFDDLEALACDLREEGISLVLDFVFNHTSNEHDWAQKARAGEEAYQGYYHLFPDREIPDLYEKTLRDIFPTVRKGSFSFDETMQKWVWTTFHNYQWDLNYTNPAVFLAILEEMLFLGNKGVEVLRLDAVPFIWKKMGTNCENLPEAHLIIQAFNHLAKIAVPSLLFTSEAIVHPDDVVSYIDRDECQMSYNPLLMALLWESMATRKTDLLALSLRRRFRIHRECSWINYIRCHDDIGWTFDDEDAHSLGIDPLGHRQFLNEFYTGQFAGSFARGVPFQYDFETGDVRISGTLASLAGLEKATIEGNQAEVDLAVKRIAMLRSVVLSIGGVPLIYLGDEWGVLNDYSYVTNPAKSADSRWIHRTRMIWEDVDKWQDPHSVPRRIYDDLLHLIRLRRKLPALAGSEMEIIKTGNSHILGYIRHVLGDRITVLVNFSDTERVVNANYIRVCGLGYLYRDLVADQAYCENQDLTLAPYQYVWLQGTPKKK
jgi:amylosucrase